MESPKTRGLLILRYWRS